MTRFALIAAAAALGVALLGGALLVGGSRQTNPPPVPVSTPAPAVPTPTAAQADPAYAALRASWLADVAASEVLRSGAGRATLRFTPDGAPQDALYLANLGPGNDFRSTVTRAGDNQLRVTLQKAHGDCPAGAAGTYRWSLSPDRSLLTMETVEDTCPARTEALARTWGRSLLEGTTVGAGFVTQFDPGFKVVLPDRSYEARTDLTDFVEIGTSSGYSLMAFKNPQPFVDACSTAEERVPWTPGAAAFVAAFRANDAFEVSEATPLTVDGHDAIHVVIGGKANYERCPGQELYQYTPKECNCHFIVGQGYADSMYLVDVGEDTILFIISPRGAIEDERLVIDSIRIPAGIPAQ